MKALFVAGRESFYTRNAVIIKGLRANGVDVIECTSMYNSYPLRYLQSLYRMIIKYKKDIDLIFVGFLGQPLVPLLRKFTKKPIIFDAFLSVYDTLCFDRRAFSPYSITGRIAYIFDKFSCAEADAVFLDTYAHTKYFIGTFGLEQNKVYKIWVGADDSIYYPRKNKKGIERFIVFYCGSYLPLQGIDYIVRSAKILEKHKDILFRITGSGMGKAEIVKLAKRFKLTNMEFTDWMPYYELPFEIAKADLCLGGHFSNIDKAKRVISGKTYQFVAMRKPVIVGDNPANRELFRDGEDVLMVDMGNAEALAEGILRLKENNSFREKIAQNGYKRYKDCCTPLVIGREIKEVLCRYLL